MDAIAQVRLEGHPMFVLSAGRALAGDKPHSLDVWNWHFSEVAPVAVGGRLRFQSGL
jgi:hypothetical protein